MNICKLILKELSHHKLSALIAVITIVIALTCIIASMETMRQFDTTTDKQLEELSKSTDSEIKKLNDQIRKTMKGLGFNVHIYPASQDLAEVYAKGYASNTMPEDYVNKLAESKIVTVNHLLPRLSRGMFWPEQNMEIVLIGVDGQVPIAHRNPKKPIMQPVPKGSAIVGYELASNSGLKVGDTLTFKGQSFKIHKIHKQRGTVDDITLWIPLQSAQEILKLPGKINAILALGCNCASIDRLGTIRKELLAILPDTQIIEIESKALARAETRNQVAEKSENTRQRIISNRSQSRSERTTFLSILTPLILIGSLTGLFTLCLFNVRERRSEIGTLLSMGVPSNKIFSLFLGRALIIGTAGTIVTLIIISILGYRLEIYWHVALLAPLLTIISAWVPTITAARQDPLITLKQD